MRIAVVADIHGNVRALRAVMDDLKKVAPDSVINLGDCVSGPLEAAETADVLISLAWTTIRGNHDRQLLDRPVDEMGPSDKAASAELKNHHKAWLSALEQTVEVEDLLLCHGTPDNDTGYLPRRSSPTAACGSRRRPRSPGGSTARSAPIVLCAHSHVPRFVALIDGRLVINPGSVGLPAYTDTEPVKHSMEMGAPHARYAVLERRKASDPWHVTFRVVAYDWEGAAAAPPQGPRGLGALDQRPGYAGL